MVIGYSQIDIRWIPKARLTLPNTTARTLALTKSRFNSNTYILLCFYISLYITHFFSKAYLFLYTYSKYIIEIHLSWVIVIASKPAQFFSPLQIVELMSFGLVGAVAVQMLVPSLTGLVISIIHGGMVPVTNKTTDWASLVSFMCSILVTCFLLVFHLVGLTLLCC